MKKIINEIKRYKIGDYFENVSMSKYTSYRIGGIVKLMVYPNSVNKLIKLLEILKEGKINHKVLGNGSNVIFSDNVYDGAIIKLDALNHLKIDDTVVNVGAGYSLMKLAYKVSRMGLSGLEFATGIPGSVGGAVYMNAGAYKSDMGYITSSIKVITPTLEVKELYNSDLDFHYRDSFLQHNPGCICIEANLVLKNANIKDIMTLIEDRKQKRLLTQPLEYPSAGSVFRNPANDFAGRLIEEAGLKGYSMGGALVSPKHANFIINYDRATANDVRNLILHVQEEVRKQHGVDLLIEQEFVNWE
ncbi:MAG: UDP-N-acetylmuramate dehydrogenase [Bacilli bacterium]|nr:UDP-N-acetylmuramate dehydrogenase [Bacilli bacterium]MDD4298377.1 UDP-N-acetylmuramate dehydrogenase [Bacilli bacterium]